MALLNVFALLVVLGVAAANPYLRVVQAQSTSPKMSAALSSGFSYCPTSLAPKISLECVAPGAKYADIFVNDVKVRREWAAPFMITGDFNGNANPWTPPSGTVTLKCVTNTDQVVVTGVFTCSTQPAVPSNGSGGATATTKADAVAATPPPQSVGVDPKYCVLIPATTYINQKSDDWVLQPDGKSLTFRPDDPFAGALPPYTARLIYEFEVPVESHYAITMASRTIDFYEHNDIFITFEQAGGLSLLRVINGKITSRRDGITKPTKSYHNQPNRYTRVALSVDHTEHTFSTTNKLKPGIKYQIIAGARSTKFQFYGLILFPCYKEQCWIWGDWFQENYLRICHLP